MYNAAPLNTFCLHKSPPPPIPIYSSISMHISDTDDWIHRNWYTSSETDRISFRLTRELIARATGNDKVFKNGLHQHKEGNVRITQHFGTFVQPLLEYKTDKCYILCVCVCSLRAMRVRHTVNPAVQYFCAFYHKRHDLKKRLLDGQTDMTKLIVTWRNFANEPNKRNDSVYIIM